VISVFERIISFLKAKLCKDCEKQIEELNLANSKLNNLVLELQNQLSQLQQKYNDDVQYYEERIKTLTELLMKGLTLPDLSDFKSKATLIEPHQIIWKYGFYNSSFADLNYYALDFESWKSVLTKISRTFVANWTNEVFDCDDFALMFNAMLIYSVYKSGFDKQLAFGIAWSKTHAYNIFIDSNNKVWIYEPQTNQIVGELGKTLAPYDTIEIWFMG
jgi:hypothetical protein